MASVRMWQLPAGCEVLMRGWGDEVVVYHSCSGDTHLVDALGAEVLNCLLQGPHTVEALLGHILSELNSSSGGIVSEDMGEAPDVERLREYVERFLEDFRRRGLVELTA